MIKNIKIKEIIILLIFCIALAGIITLDATSKTNFITQLDKQLVIPRLNFTMP